MDDGNVITITSGVTRQNHWWGYILAGTKEALIAAALAEDSWFPDGVERNKHGKVVRSRHLEVDGRKVTVTQEQKKSRYSVFVRYTEDEARASESRRDALAQLDDPRKLAKKHLDIAGCCIITAFNLVNSPEYSWAFSPEVQDKAKRLGSELIELFRDSPIRSRTGALAQGDAEFQRFIGRITQEIGSPHGGKRTT